MKDGLVSGHDLQSLTVDWNNFKVGVFDMGVYDTKFIPDGYGDLLNHVTVVPPPRNTE